MEQEGESFWLTGKAHRETPDGDRGESNPHPRFSAMFPLFAGDVNHQISSTALS